MSHNEEVQIEKFCAELKPAMQSLIANKIDAAEFMGKLAGAMVVRCGLVYEVIAVATANDLAHPIDFLNKYGITPYTIAGNNAVVKCLQRISTELQCNDVVWEARAYGSLLVISQCVKGAPAMAAILKRGAVKQPTMQDYIDKIKARVVDLYERRVNQSEVIEDIAALIRQETKTPWKTTKLNHKDIESQSPRLFIEGPQDRPFLVEAWDAAVPSGALMSLAADAINESVQRYYDIPLKTRFSGWLANSGEARCIHLRFCTAPATGGGSDVLQTNMILTLDEIESTQESRQKRYGAFIPDSGDRSRNEPVYLMSAKATRSLTNGRSLAEALDDIRHVAKQQGWSDVQAFGQQLLFIS